MHDRSSSSHICYCYLSLKVIVCLTCKQCTGLLLYNKQTTFTPFALYSIVGKVNNNALLIQTYTKVWAIYRVVRVSSRQMVDKFYSCMF